MNQYGIVGQLSIVSLKRNYDKTIWLLAMAGKGPYKCESADKSTMSPLAKRNSTVVLIQLRDGFASFQAETNRHLKCLNIEIEATRGAVSKTSESEQQVVATSLISVGFFTVVSIIKEVLSLSTKGRFQILFLALLEKDPRWLKRECHIVPLIFPSADRFRLNRIEHVKVLTVGIVLT